MPVDTTIRIQMFIGGELLADDLVTRANHAEVADRHARLADGRDCRLVVTDPANPEDAPIILDPWPSIMANF